MVMQLAAPGGQPAGRLRPARNVSSRVRCSSNISRSSVRLGVVVAEQVQDAVRREQQQLLLGGVAGLRGLPRRDGRAEHDVAEHALLGLLAVAAGAQLVHREAHHVGGPGQVHPLDVQHLHGGLVHQLEAQVGAGVDPHLLQHVAGAGRRAPSRRAPCRSR